MSDELTLIVVLLNRAKQNANYNIRDLQRWRFPTDDLRNVVDDIDAAVNRLQTLLGNGPNADDGVSSSSTKT